MKKPRIVVLGAGYAGLMTVTQLQKKLKADEAEIILVNKHNYHYITTRLHEPAAGTAKDDEVKIMINTLVDFDRVQFKKDVVKSIHTDKKQVELEKETLSYDYLVVGLGGVPKSFGIPGIKEHAFQISTLNRVRDLRLHIEKMFEAYQQDHDDSRLTFVVGGAGFTGVEFLCELTNRIPGLCSKYNVPAEKVKVICVEASPTVLPGFDPEMAAYAANGLKERGVEVLVNSPIKECHANGIKLADGTQILTRTTVWSGGVKGNPIVEKSGLETLDGRVKINKYLEVPGNPDVMVIGDCSVFFDENGKPYPPTAQIAIQQGVRCAENLVAKLRHQKPEPFVPDIKGTVMSLGKTDAAGVVFSKRIKGLIAAAMKQIIEMRYLLQVGGLKLVLNRFFV